jgi:putative oxidoreductase
VDFGLLILRLGIGGLFILHGWPKISGGPGLWAGLGSAVGTFGVPLGAGQWGFLSDPTVWGCAAAIAEFVGGIMLVLGLFVRPFAFLMLVTMVVAINFIVQPVLAKGDLPALLDQKTFGAWGSAAKAAAAFLAIVFAGGGRFAFGRAIPGLRRRWFA